MQLNDPKTIQPIPSNAQRVFKGEIFEIWQWQQQLFDGTFATFEKAVRQPSVGILPVTMDHKIIVTYQQQPGMQAFVSLVGGVVDSGENIEAAAHRELLEETGMQAESLEFWYSYQLSTKIEWPIYQFVARGCSYKEPVQLDPGEKISLREVSWDEFLEIVVSDNFRDTKVTMLLLKALQDPQELRKIKDFIFS